MSEVVNTDTIEPNATQTATGNADSAAPISDGKLDTTQLTDKEAIRAIHLALGGQRVAFPTYKEAEAKIVEAAAKTNNFGGLPVLGFDAEDKPIDEEKFNWYISTVTKRMGGDSKVNSLRAVVVYPMPKVELFIAEQSDYVAKLVERENADIVYSQGIRDATTIDDLQNVLNGIQITTEDFVNNQKSATDTSVFDDMWSDFRAAFVKAKPAFDKAIPAKPLVMKAFRSKSFAQANPYTETLAKAGTPEADGWDMLLAKFIQAASKAKDPKTGEPKNYDLSVMESWRDTRATFKLSYNVAPADVDVSTLDFG